jgi:phosphonate transport system ATP-binding protein
MLEIKQLHKAYTANKPVLRGINLQIQNSGITAIIGPSGTGKSTLIRCINRLVNPTSGEIWFEGQNLASLKGTPLRHARRRIGMVFQEYNLVERLSVMENVLSGRLGYMSAWAAWRRQFATADIERALALLTTVGLQDFARQRADSLSGGQRQRVGIARAVMQSPSLLLADEPTSSLDPKTSVEIMQLLQSIAQEQNIPVLMNIHQVALAKRFASRVIGMQGGQVVYDGDAAGLSNDILLTIYGGESWIAE